MCHDVWISHLDHCQHCFWDIGLNQGGVCSAARDILLWHVEQRPWLWPLLNSIRRAMAERQFGLVTFGLGFPPTASVHLTPL